jgi:hypothetical protein
MDFELPPGALFGGELQLAGPAAGGLPDGGVLLDGGFQGEFVGSALEWDDLMRDDTLAANPAAVGALGTDGDPAAVKTAALPDVVSDQAVSTKRAFGAARQRRYRERLKEREAQLPAELEAAERAVAALRAENAALEERVAALSLVGEYTKEMAAVVAAAAEQEQARQAPAGAPSGGGRLSLLAGAVFRAMPPSACKLLMAKVPSDAQVRRVRCCTGIERGVAPAIPLTPRAAPPRRFFAQHATVDQFRAMNEMRATWVNQLAQQVTQRDRHVCTAAPCRRFQPPAWRSP